MVILVWLTLGAISRFCLTPPRITSIDQNIIENIVDAKRLIQTQSQLTHTYSIADDCILLVNNLSMGGLRSKPDTKKITASREGYGLTYAYSHMCGWRLYMEDAHLAINLTDFKNQLFAIFDGHGGAQVSNFAAKHFAKELQKNSNYKKRNYEVALKQTFLRMDELLLTPWGKSEITKIQRQMAEKENGPKSQHQQLKAGTTANVCLITPETIYVANAGDSRSIAYSSKAECIELSKDHKPENQQLMRIKKAGGKVVEGRINGKLNLSRSLGDFDYKNDKSLPLQQQMVVACPDIVKIKNEGISFILLGCDGIWETMSNEQMAEWIAHKLEITKNLGAILQDLFDDLICKDSTKAENGLDNMSAILIKFIKSKK